MNWGDFGRGLLTTPPLPLLLVFVTLTCAFSYGREDLDVLGLWLLPQRPVHRQLPGLPPTPNPPRPPTTRLQERLLRKLGQHAHPFFHSEDAPTLCRAKGSGTVLGAEVRHLLQKVWG